MRFLDAAAVLALSPFGPLIEALAEAHRQARPEIGRVLLSPAAETGHGEEGFLVLPAWAPGRVLGVKMASVFPQNVAAGEGLPTVQAAYQLFDGRNGRPLAVIDGTVLTLRKTAADSGLGAKLLAREDAEVLLMIGAGALAPHLIEAHRTARPSIRKFLIWNRSAERRDHLVAQLRDEGLAVEVADDREAAVRAADVICAATMATEALVAGAWLKPGAHLDLVGGFTPEMREADDEAVRRSSVFVDYRGSTLGEAGDLTQPMEAGVLSETDVLADLFDLCQGRHPGRRNEDEITFYKNGGGGHLDLFTAEFLIRQDAAGQA